MGRKCFLQIIAVISITATVAGCGSGLIGLISDIKNDVIIYGSVTGKVLETTRSPIANAAVVIKTNDDSFSCTTTSDASGNFIFTDIASGSNSYKIEVSAAGYLPSMKNNVTVPENRISDEGIIYLVNSGAASGTITGWAIDANDGTIIIGATIKFIRYDDFTTSTMSDGSGNFTSASLTPGSYTVKMSFAGYYDLTLSNQIVNGNVNIYNQALCSFLSGSDIRLYVLWGSAPSDLDLHVVGPTQNANTGDPNWDGEDPNRFHVYYINSSYTESTGLYEDSPWTTALVQDSLFGIGPESINIANDYPYGTYTFSVYNMSETDWYDGEYNPVTRIYDASGLVREIPFPSNSPGANEWYWKVAKIDITGPASSDRSIFVPDTNQFWDNGWNDGVKSTMDW